MSESGSEIDLLEQVLTTFKLEKENKREICTVREHKYDIKMYRCSQNKKICTLFNTKRGLTSD